VGKGLDLPILSAGSRREKGGVGRLPRQSQYKAPSVDGCYIIHDLKSPVKNFASGGKPPFFCFLRNWYNIRTAGWLVSQRMELRCDEKGLLLVLSVHPAAISRGLRSIPYPAAHADRDNYQSATDSDRAGLDAYLYAFAYLHAAANLCADASANRHPDSAAGLA
jgi:hypothetical protein